MGLFNYSKPGPGVDRNAPKKKGVFLYSEIFARKISKLVSLNLLYVLCSLPMIILYFSVFLFTLPSVFDGIFRYSDMAQGDLAIMYTIFSMFLTILCVVIFGTGPASASLAYVLREYSKEEHVWLTSTFFGKIKENFKQELAIAVIDLLFVFVAVFATGFYAERYFSTGELTWFLMLLVLVIFSLTFMFMHYYIHQLVVTFDNSLKEIFKNALLFSMSTFPVCLILTAFITVLLFAVFNFLNPVLSLALVVFILICFVRFPVEFYVQSVIKKIVLNNIEEEKNDDKEEQVVFSDSHGSEK